MKTSTTSTSLTTLPITSYLAYCRQNKRLDPKTIKAYRIDLTQFAVATTDTNINIINPDIIKSYIATLHNTYKPKTVKRKIASLKAFFSYLEENAFISASPFLKIHTKFREPVQLPRIIPLNTIEKLLSTIYLYHHTAKTNYSRHSSIQAIAIIELLFATGIRISELCSIRIEDIDQITLLEKCYLSEPEKESYLASRQENYKMNMDKVKLARKKYRNQGEYIEDILK